jgi:hypothetical protein
MKKYKIRFYGFGIAGTTEMLFNTEPSIEMLEDTLALHMDKGLAKIESDTFYSGTRFTLAYEEIFDETKKEKELILGSWV